jgi:hypothetical protein
MYDCLMKKKPRSPAESQRFQEQTTAFPGVNHALAKIND